MPFYKKSSGGGSYDDTDIRNQINELEETLNQLLENDDIDIEEKVLNGNTLTLGLEPYQKTNIIDGTTIVLPSVDKYTEIHLFFNTTSDITITMPSGLLYQKAPIVSANKTYEFIFTYTNTDIGWVFGYVEYSE